MPTPIYVEGAELGDLGISWYDTDGSLINFASGYTFVVKVGSPGSAALFTKSTGITGAATVPNVTVGWATSGELNGLSAGTYSVQVAATRTSDSKVRTQRSSLQIIKAVT
jgi:hypothetical protein